MPPKPTKVLPKYLDKATEDVTTLDLLRAFRDGGFLRDFPHLALTMFAVILRANRDENYSCRPAYALLAQDTGLAEQVVRRHCRALEKDGLLTRTFRPRTTNVFTVEVHFILQVARGVMQDRATGKLLQGWNQDEYRTARRERYKDRVKGKTITGPPASGGETETLPW